MASAPLLELLRWETSGGTWEVESDVDGVLTVALLTCTGGERMGTVIGQDADLRRHVLEA